MKRALTAKVVLACSIAFHAATVPIFAIVVVPQALYTEPPLVYYLFLAVSGFLATISYIVRTKRHFRVSLLVRAALLLLFCRPFGPYLDIRLLLIMSITVEIGIFESFPSNLIASTLLLLASLAFANVFVYLTRPLRGRFVADLVRYILSASLVTVLSSMMALFREHMVEYGREMLRLRSVVEELTRAGTGFLEFARTAEARSIKSERNRLSAELHDSLGYRFTNLKMILEASKDFIDRDTSRLRELLETGIGQVEEGMLETRRALHLLRERPENEPPFLSAVHRLIDVFRNATGIGIAVDFANFPSSTGHQIDSALYHFIQEGLVNSFSHGKANRIDVIFWADEEELQVVIEDNGIGVDTIVEGIGLRGMRERLGMLGGTLSMGNTSAGFRIVARVPAQEELWRN